LKLTLKNVFLLLSGPLKFGDFLNSYIVAQMRLKAVKMGGRDVHSPSRLRTDSAVKAGVTHYIIR